MQSKRKILFYLWSFSLGGGAEKVLATIANNLDKRIYETDILEIEHFDKGFPMLCKDINILKPYKMKKHSRLVETFLWRIRFWYPRLVRRYLVKDIYDIEISFTIMNPPMPFSKRKNVKKIAWIHGSIENMPKNRKYYKLHKKHLSSADAIIAISEKTRRSIEEVFPEYKHKIVTIYNGYDFENIRRLAEENSNIMIQEQSICSIGRIERLKGTDRTLELIRKLHEKGCFYHMYYIGAGEQESELREKAVRYNLNEYVHFLGYQVNPYKYLRHMKVLVTMSLQEGFSGTCVEALSLGIPFVSTDVGGAKELSQDGKFGKIIKTDEEAMEAIIQYVSTENRPRLSEMEEYIHKFTIDNQMIKINALLEGKLYNERN